ncbi:hypothetical protein VCRA2119O381_800017 [Vibrio crassostreae]|nr:hypothetical protein VCRA2119O381_800017 [Vibrio crassostreae]
MHRRQKRMGIKNTTRILDISYCSLFIGGENSMLTVKGDEELTKYDVLPDNA